MHSVLAVAKVTLKDAFRKKVLFTVLFFAVVLTVASGFLPSTRPADQMRQLMKVCLGGIGFFGMVVAIFLSAPSLPDDISQKTIFTVLTKPARRWEIIGGKIAGLGAVLAIMLVVMGVISFAYIKVWAWRLGDDPEMPPRLSSNRATWADRVNHRGLTMEISEPMIASNRAIASGVDRITFYFDGLDKLRYEGDTVYAQVTIFSHSSSFDSQANEGTAALEVKNPSSGEVRRVVFAPQTLVASYIGFPRSLIDKEGRLEAAFVKHLVTGSYSAMASSVAVLSQPSGFALNFLKGLALMFMQYMVLVFIAVGASTVLTSTVSTIFALFVFFTGSLTEILRDSAISLGAGVDIFTAAEHSHSAIETHMTPLRWLANLLLRYFYLGISVAFPDLSFYSPSEAISQNLHISGAWMWHGLWYGALYACVSFLVAWAIFRRKEVA